MTKVMTVVGTRPEIIRLSTVIKLLDQSVEHVLVHTGQNYDHSLNDVFFEDLGLRSPDHFLQVDTRSLASMLAGVLQGVEKAILSERPDAFLVLGDTNSSIGAVIAKRMGVPVYHMEAGNRCFDENVPEEINRRIVDHVADFNLVYTEHGRRNLLAEGIHPRRILLTGSPLTEVLHAQRDAIEGSDVLERLGLLRNEYFLVSAHREENVDLSSRLSSLLDCLDEVANRFDLPVLVSTHPRTRKMLDRLNRRVNERVLFHEPVGFNDYIQLQLHARCVLSDSGTISEESSILGFPAVTLRDSTERPEALDAGSIIMTGLDPQNVVEGLVQTMRRGRSVEVPAEYSVTNCSERTVNFILSTHRRHEEWSGLRLG